MMLSSDTMREIDFGKTSTTSFFYSDTHPTTTIHDITKIIFKKLYKFGSDRLLSNLINSFDFV